MPEPENGAEGMSLDVETVDPPITYTRPGTGGWI